MSTFSPCFFSFEHRRQIDITNVDYKRKIPGELMGEEIIPGC